MQRLLQSLSLLACLCWPLLGSAALTNGRIEIASIKGTATLVDPQGRSIQAQTGFIFQEGYKVLAGRDSVVELIFSNGAKYVLESEASIFVRTFRQVPSSANKESGLQPLDRESSPSVTEVQLLSGKVIGLSSLLDPLSTSSLRSPVGVVSVRGTTFSQERGTIFTMELGKEPKSGNEQIIVECFRGVMEASVFEQHNGPITIPERRKLVAVVTDTRMATNADKDRPVAGQSKPSDEKTSPDADSPDGRNVKGTEVYIGDVSIPRYGVVGEFARGPLGSANPSPGYTPSPNVTGSAKTSDIIQQVLDNINKVVEQQQINPSPTGG